MKDADGMKSTVCMVQCGGTRYGIAAAAIREVLETQTPTTVPLAPAWVAGVIAYRGDVLTAVSLAAVLGRAPVHTSATLLILENEGSGERFALVVDQVHDLAVIDEGSREPNPETLHPLYKAVFDGAYCTPEEFVIRLNVPQLSPGIVGDLLGLEPNSCEPQPASRALRFAEPTL